MAVKFSVYLNRRVFVMSMSICFQVGTDAHKSILSRLCSCFSRTALSKHMDVPEMYPNTDEPQ